MGQINYALLMCDEFRVSARLTIDVTLREVMDTGEFNIMTSYINQDVTVEYQTKVSHYDYEEAVRQYEREVAFIKNVMSDDFAEGMSLIV